MCDGNLHVMTQNDFLEIICDRLADMTTATEMLVALNKLGNPDYDNLRRGLVAFITDMDEQAQRTRLEMNPPYMEGELKIASQRTRGIITFPEYWQQWLWLYTSARSN